MEHVSGARCSSPAGMVRAGLLLLACVAGIHAYYILRERHEHVCGLGHYGSPFGSAQRLVVTHLTPGVADWNIAVPMPPMCKNGHITGVDTTVCDADVPPEVTMKDLVSARVYRKGQLKSYATVNVTVYCVLPSHSSSSVTAPAPQHADTRSTYEVLSSELISNEVMSSEVTSIEAVPSGLTSNELNPKVVNPITDIVMTPLNEATTPQIELTSTSEEVTPSPKKTTQTGETAAPLYKVTIKITPPSKKGKKNKRPRSHKVIGPSLSNKEEFSTPYVGTPPRNSMMTPQHHGAPSQYTGAPPQYAGAPPQYAGAPLQYAGAPPQYAGAPPQYAGAPPQHAGAPPQHVGAPPQYKHMLAPHKATPPEYTGTSAEYEDMPPIYNMIPPPLIMAPMFRPISLLGPRLRFWFHQKPSLLIRHI